MDSGVERSNRLPAAPAPATPVLVLGRGRLGSSLAGAMSARLGPGRAWREALPFEPDSLIILAVPDPALAGLAVALAGAAPPGAAFIHLSGALGIDVLAPLLDAGHEVGSMHPLQSFPVQRPPAAFAGSMFAIEASSPALEARLRGVVIGLGGLPRVVPGRQRTLYHAAAVMASNYLVALAAQAASVLASLGWDRDEALGALLPLMKGMVANLEEQRLPGALIGPIRRGDPETVVRHLAALEALAGSGLASPVATYRMLGRAALELAREAGLEEASATRIAEALTQGGSDQEVIGV